MTGMTTGSAEVNAEDEDEPCVPGQTRIQASTYILRRLAFRESGGLLLS